MTPADHSKSLIHTQAVVESTSIGPGTSVGPFAVVLEGARIGSGCTISSHAFIDANVALSDDVTVKPGAKLCGSVTVGKGASIGVNSSLDGNGEEILVHDRAVIGAGVSVTAAISIGRAASISGGAVLDHNVPAFAIVEGNPARITGYVGTSSVPGTGNTSPQRRPSRVRGVEWIDLPVITDIHGRLAVAETGAGLPFTPKRYFVVHDVPSREARGEHAHRKLHQVLSCVSGECSIIVDDGSHREQVILDTPGAALHVHPMVWAAQFGFSEDAVLLVLASEPYDSEDYIRDYDAFREAVRNL